MRAGARRCLGGVGPLGELNELFARLRAEHVARACVAVVVPIRRGKAELARQLVEEEPPFEIEGVRLEQHHVFVGEREVVFFFEGDQAAEDWSGWDTHELTISREGARLNAKSCEPEGPQDLTARL
jgi:hypothetical protein